MYVLCTEMMVIMSVLKTYFLSLYWDRHNSKMLKETATVIPALSAYGVINGGYYDTSLLYVWTLYSVYSVDPLHLNM